MKKRWVPVVLLMGWVLVGGLVISSWGADGGLIDASRAGDIGRVTSLIASKADVNLKDEKGGTALMYACVEGHVEVVRLLLAAKADVNARTAGGETALIYAAQSGLIRKMAGALAKGILKESGIEADSKDTDAGAKEAEAAKTTGEIVRLLLAARADVNAGNKQGQTALMYAAIDGNPEVVHCTARCKGQCERKERGGPDSAQDRARLPQRRGGQAPQARRRQRMTCAHSWGDALVSPCLQTTAS